MILENFLAMAATLERENIRVRTMGGRKIKAKQGGYSGGRAPYGYFVQGGVLAIETNEAETVRMIFALRDSGMTYQQIADRLNTENKVNKSGGRFSISTLQVILGNENLYRGMYRYGGGEWVKGQHKAIL
jgi:site-specific DNA recombinase